jgi:mRNA-degrading endonuclease RelE of RelBE toxin-antitoxin system
VSADDLAGGVAPAVWELITGPLGAAHHGAGNPLRPPYDGQHVARRSTYRVDDQRRVVTILAIKPRADAYRAR